MLCTVPNRALVGGAGPCRPACRAWDVEAEISAALWWHDVMGCDAVRSPP